MQTRSTFSSDNHRVCWNKYSIVLGQVLGLADTSCLDKGKFRLARHCWVWQHLTSTGVARACGRWCVLTEAVKTIMTAWEGSLAKGFAGCTKNQAIHKCKRWKHVAGESHTPTAKTHSFTFTTTLEHLRNKIIALTMATGYSQCPTTFSVVPLTLKHTTA